MSVDQPKPSQAVVRGIELTYFEWGEADDVPVLFAHATGFHGRCWDQTIRALGAGYRAIAVDLRGHGRSTKQGPYGWLEFGADLTALVEALDLRGVIGVGHSMGGHAVTQAAGHAPERFARLVLVDPVILAPEVYAQWPQNRAFSAPEEHGTARRKNDWASWEEMYRRFEHREPFSTWQADVLRDYCEHGVLPAETGGGFVLACPPLVEASIYMESAGSDVHPVVRTLPHPVVVMRGYQPAGPKAAMDFVSSPTWAGLADAFAHGRDRYLPELSHFIPMQRPDLVAAEIRGR